MPGRLVLIWDYDAALGQINASYPYNFNEENITNEIANVDKILEFGREFEVKMTFGCLGFAGEPGRFPYHVPDQIRCIFSAGHEIASHSWKHEWFPYLEREQIKRSLTRSKETLEACISQAGSVKGFIPPFSRPMSWYRKGAFSLGDRAFGPGYPGSDLGSLLKIIGGVGYKWCRVAFRPLWKKLLYKDDQRNTSLAAWKKESGVVCVPHHCTGFDEVAVRLTKRAIRESGTVIVSGHPSGLSRKGNESAEHLRSFFRRVAHYQHRGQLTTLSVSECIELS